MSLSSFIPGPDSDKDLWLKNFAAKLPLYAAKYGISPADITDMQQSSALFTFWMNYHNQLEEYTKKVTSYKNEWRDGIKAGASVSVLPSVPVLGAVPPAVQPGIFVRANSLAQRIKKNTLFTLADGKDLGINTVQAVAVDMQTAKPTISVRLIQGGLVEVVWLKQGFNGVEIHVDRGSGVYELLAIDSFPNYIDTFALPVGQVAIWKYKAIYLKRDTRVGQWSDEVNITVTGTQG